MADDVATSKEPSRTSGCAASRPRLAGAVLSAALLLAGCGTTVAGSDSAPPVLRIGAGSEGAAGAIVSGGRTDGPTLAGTLPAGPATAAVYRYHGGVEEATVRALATALGLTGTVEREAHGWVVRSGDAELAVRDDGAGGWAYARDTRQCAVTVDPAAPAGSDVTVGCAVAPPPGSPRLGPDAAVARAAAAPVLAAAGLAGAATRVTVSSPQTYVSVDPVIDGSPTSGISTTVTVARSGITAASGTLATPKRAQQYPLVTAKEAYAALLALPRPDIAIACPDHVDGAPLTGLCTRPEVTGAALGLVLRSDAGDAVLVPAWLFTVRGSGAPIPMVAVAGRFLADPDGTSDTGSGSGSGSSTGGADVAPGSPGEQPAGPGATG